MELEEHINQLKEKKQKLENEINLISSQQLSDQIKYYLIGDEKYRELVIQDPFINSVYREGIDLMIKKICESLNLNILKKHLRIQYNGKSRYPLCELMLDYSEIIDPRSILYIKNPNSDENLALNAENLFASNIILDFATLGRSIYMVSTADQLRTTRAYRIASQNNDLWKFLGTYTDDTLSVTKAEFTDHLIKCTMAFRQTGGNLCEHLGIRNEIVSSPEKIAAHLYKPWRTGNLQNDPIVISNRMKANRELGNYRYIKNSKVTPKDEYLQLPSELTKLFSYLNNSIGLQIKFQYTQYDSINFPKNNPTNFSDPNENISTTDQNKYVQDLLNDN